jgi:hypothetical protein
VFRKGTESLSLQVNFACWRRAIMGTLIKGLGADQVIWGTDSIWTGSPQGQIEVMPAARKSREDRAVETRRDWPPTLSGMTPCVILGLRDRLRLGRFQWKRLLELRERAMRGTGELAGSALICRPNDKTDRRNKWPAQLKILTRS